MQDEESLKNKIGDNDGINLIDRRNKINNLKIYKEALLNNKQILIDLLQSKEKEKNEKEKQISLFNLKENSYLRNRYSIEDMIYILQEYHSINIKPEDNINSFSDKAREKFLELIRHNEKLDKFTFLSLNEQYSYYLIEDVIAISEKEISEILSNIDGMTSSLTEIIKENLRIIFEMIYNKVELIREQNKLILYLYTIFSNLDKKDIINGKPTNYIGNEKNKTYNKEYIYKDMIIEFLKEAYRTDEIVNDASVGFRDQIEADRQSYLDKKKTYAKKLEERSRLVTSVDTTDLSQILSYKHGQN
jgi:hypothetical protein